ncbi:MAG: hypothetical protein Q8P24_11160 [Desulfobacterales bacterium]|nr:hypothetical protein [Desulfobacterales bacterium]
MTDRLKTVLLSRTNDGPRPILKPDGSARTISRSTVHRELSIITAILNWSVTRKYLAVNPLAGYKKPRRDDAVILPPSIEEVRQILAVAPPHLVRALTVCYYTGLRPGLANCSGCGSTTWILTEGLVLSGPPIRTAPWRESCLYSTIFWRH